MDPTLNSINTAPVPLIQDSLLSPASISVSYVAVISSIREDDQRLLVLF